MRPEGPAISHPFSPRFSVALERRDEETVVRPTGELDLDTAPLLGRALRAVQGADRRVVLDLRELSSADSAGLRAILLALDRAERLDAEVHVIPGEVARRLFEVAGLEARLSSVSADD